MKLIVRLLFLHVVLIGSVHAEQSALSKDFQGYMVAHHYVAVRLASGGANTQTVEAHINGKRVTLIVDTGCPRTCLSLLCARSLGLDVRDTGRAVNGVGGEIKGGNAGVALIQSFKFAFGEINRSNNIVVLPKGADVDWGADGYLGLDYLTLNAAIYPVGGRGLLMKPGPLPSVFIGDYMTKLGFKPVPLTAANGRLWVEGHINGHVMKFALDSGAVLSNFRAASIQAALHQDMESTILYVTGLDGKNETSFNFTPTNMDLGRFPILHETFLATNSFSFETEKDDGLVGVDLMGSHHAIIDLGDGILWMKQ